jgi:hypothetical protein
MYDPRVGRFTQTDPLVGNRPAEHYTYAANNPVSTVDPQGLYGGPVFPPEYWKDEEFRRGFHSSPLPVASVIRVAAEPALIVRDTAVAVYAKAFGNDITMEDVEMSSGLGNRLKANVLGGKSGWQNARAAAVTALALPTGGGSVLADNVATVFEEEMTPEEASGFLWQGAVDQLVAVGVGAGLSVVTGNGLTGRGSQIDPALRQSMADAVVHGRRIAGKTTEGHATFAQAVRLDAWRRPTAMSGVAESVPGRGAYLHAEPQALAQVRGLGPKVVVVDQFPCGNCLPHMQGSITGSIQVFTLRNPGYSAGPKGAAIKAAQGLRLVETVPTYGVPFNPPVAPPITGDEWR